MANRTVAYLNCQILVGGSFLKRMARHTPLIGPCPHEGLRQIWTCSVQPFLRYCQSYPNFCVGGAQFIQFGYTVGLCSVYLQNRQSEAILRLPLGIWKLENFWLQGGSAPNLYYRPQTRTLLRNPPRHRTEQTARPTPILSRRLWHTGPVSCVVPRFSLPRFPLLHFCSHWQIVSGVGFQFTDAVSWRRSSRRPGNQH